MMGMDVTKGSARKTRICGWPQHWDNDKYKDGRLKENGDDYENDENNNARTMKAVTPKR